MECIAVFNVVTNTIDKPEVVLVRALEPLDGIELMQKRRNTQSVVILCNGPGKLCSALGISRDNYADDLCSNTLYIKDFLDISKTQYCCITKN